MDKALTPYASASNSQKRVIVNPLEKCFVACHQGHRSLLSGLYGVARNGGKTVHCGVDLYAEVGTKCLAIGDGYAIDTGFMKGYGKYLLYETQSPSGVKIWAFYAHLEKRLVKPDPKRLRLIPAGSLIALSGNSGVPHEWIDRNYPHLHFEIWKTSDAAKVTKNRLKYRLNPIDILPFVSFAPILEKLESVA